MENLYGIDLTNANWTKPCGGNVGDDSPESCMEFTRFDGGIAIRDSKIPGVAPMRFSDAELTAFLGAI
ncbi:DUF397 domain-containing protein [Streptosporangium saharense]|uniref:DUF397 domain-containing protein n=1 Tax=Streptosporangium saharense TaxID=1706840 RepID=UPI003447C759